tara:strand:- start:151 stop:333 length:183 start_codon:yes stop_codon:yes gene_type:complete
MKKAIEYTLIGTAGVALSVTLCNYLSKDKEDYVEIDRSKTMKLMLYWGVPAFIYLMWREY